MKKITELLIFEKDFISNSQELYKQLIEKITWNENMKSRKTQCFGEPYDYSEQNYDFKPMSKEMENISILINQKIGFLPNNCLLNYYPDGNSKMGFHGDTIKMLEQETGIAIISLGETRIFQVRRKSDPNECYNYLLPCGSLFYMPNSIQEKWQHGLPKIVSKEGRISMTFRKMIPQNILHKKEKTA